jgi:predicted metal-dependent phosphoesterase TrpH
METYVDLHVHTNASDSSRTLEEVVQKAQENDIKIISITDHNTMDAYNQPFPTSNISVIPGIEITTNYNEDIQMHILGYGVDTKNESLNKKLQTMQYSYLRALQRMMLLIDKEFNIRVQEELKSRSLKIKRKNICAIMMELTPLKSEKDIYEKYLNYHSLDLKFTYLSSADAISVILEAGGIPVLAHPHKLATSVNDMEKMILVLKAAGLLGIEVYHPSQINFEKIYLELALKHSLLISGGSDDHGDYSPEIKFGYIGNNKLESRKITLLERTRYLQ